MAHSQQKHNRSGTFNFKTFTGIIIVSIILIMLGFCFCVYYIRKRCKTEAGTRLDTFSRNSNESRIRVEGDQSLPNGHDRV